MPNELNDQVKKNHETKQPTNQGFENRPGAAAAQRKSCDEPETAGGREGTFSQEDEENLEGIEKEWSPSSNQSER